MSTAEFWSLIKLVIGWVGFALFFGYIFGSFMSSLQEPEDEESGA